MTTTSSQAALNTTNTLAFGGTGTAASVVAGNGVGGVTAVVGGSTSASSATGIGNNLNSNNGNNIKNNNNNLNNAHQNNSSANATNQRSVSEAGKRKKLKTRNATVPNTSYSKDHLDAWLETCLKDASTTQLSSSSEFLDYNPNFTGNKTMFTMQQQPQMSMQQQQQQQQQQHQQQYPLSQHQQQQQQQQQQLLPSNPQPTNHLTHQHTPHQQQQQQQQFAMRNHHHHLPQTASMFSGGYPAPFSLGFQKSMPNVMKHSSSLNNRYSMMYPTSSQLYQQHDGSQDFASLPPIVNIMGGTSEHEQNSTDVLDGSGSIPNISRGFRFSDPCLLNPSDNDSKISGQNTPDRRNYLPSDIENNKFFAALMEQINLLHETNTKICRNLHETKVDIEALKHAPNWGMRHRRDSLSGLSTHSQPMVFGGGFGTQSPAPTYHSGAYTPGMMTDVVREVKEAARVREDALLSRVKAMVEERQWSLNEGSLRMMRDIEELKSQIQHLRADRKESNKRMTHLEAENKYMRQMLGTILNNRSSSQNIIYEHETFRPRHKNFPPSRRSNSLNLNYGTIHHQPAPSSYSVEEQEENVLNISETPLTASTDHIGSTDNGLQQSVADLRNSFSSSDGGGGGGSGGLGSAGAINSNGDVVVPMSLSSTSIINGSGAGALSPPKFALISTPAVEHKRSREKPKTNQEEEKEEEQQVVVESQELRRELTEAMAARKEADDRIIALEKLVKNLQVNVTNSPYAPPSRSASSAVTLPNGVGPGRGFNVVGGGNGSVGYSLKLQPIPANIAAYQPYQQLQHLAQTTASSTSVSSAHATSKLSVAGPITDL